MPVMDLPVDLLALVATRSQERSCACYTILTLLTDSDNAISRSCHWSIPHASAERLCSAISNEKAQMEAYDALADQAYAEAIEDQQRMQQELDQVHDAPRVG